MLQLDQQWNLFKKLKIKFNKLHLSKNKMIKNIKIIINSLKK